MRREALKLALEALEASKGFVISARRNMEFQHNASAIASLPQLADLEKRHLEAIDALQEALAQPQPQQKPKFLYDEEDSLLHDSCCDAPTGCNPLYTSPPAQQSPWCMKMNGCKTKCEDCPDKAPKQRKPLTDGVFVPLDILEAAEISLGSFCSDHGWSAVDMQTMDNLSAYIAKHKAANGIKDTP